MNFINVFISLLMVFVLAFTSSLAYPCAKVEKTEQKGVCKSFMAHGFGIHDVIDKK